MNVWCQFNWIIWDWRGNDLRISDCIKYTPLKEHCCSALSQQKNLQPVYVFARWTGYWPCCLLAWSAIWSLSLILSLWFGLCSSVSRTLVYLGTSFLACFGFLVWGLALSVDCVPRGEDFLLFALGFSGLWILSQTTAFDLWEPWFSCSPVTVHLLRHSHKIISLWCNRCFIQVFLN